MVSFKGEKNSDVNEEKIEHVRRTRKEIETAEFAAIVADKMMKNSDAMKSKDAYREALEKELIEAGMDESVAKDFSSKIEIGLAYQGEKDPLKDLSTKRVMALDELRANILDKVMEAFIPIFGAELGREKAEEFAMLLLGSPDRDESQPKDEKKALIYQIRDQIKSIVESYGENVAPAIFQEIVREQLVSTISKNARADFDSFVLNEALMANGNSLLNVFHDALVAGTGRGTEDIKLPFNLKI